MYPASDYVDLEFLAVFPSCADTCPSSKVATNHVGFVATSDVALIEGTSFNERDDVLTGRDDRVRRTVEEMAALFGLGTTAFTEKVKNYTGFSPLNYLINIRISEAIKRLKRPDVNFTNIALETGFYSSQHFSTTFKKLTGYTPGQFRKQNASNLK